MAIDTGLKHVFSFVPCRQIKVERGIRSLIGIVDGIVPPSLPFTWRMPLLIEARLLPGHHQMFVELVEPDGETIRSIGGDMPVTTDDTDFDLMLEVDATVHCYGLHELRLIVDGDVMAWRPFKVLMPSQTEAQ